MEAVAALLALGPIALLLLGMLRLVWLRLHPRPVERRSPGSGRAGPPRPRGPAGDRSPNQPLVPVLSGGAALEEPRPDEVVEDSTLPRRIAG